MKFSNLNEEHIEALIPILIPVLEKERTDEDYISWFDLSRFATDKECSHIAAALAIMRMRDVYQNEEQIDLSSVESFVCESILAAVWKTPENETKLPWEIEERKPTLNELFSLMNGQYETLSPGGAYISMQPEYYHEEDIDKVLLSMGIDACEDLFNPNDPIEIKYNNFNWRDTIFSDAIDFSIVEISSWLEQWDYDHIPRLFWPYRNGDNLYVLSPSGGMAVIKSPFFSCESLYCVPFEEIDCHWVIQGFQRDIQLCPVWRLEDDIECLNVVMSYLKSHATRKEDSSGRMMYTLPWI